MNSALLVHPSLVLLGNQASLDSTCGSAGCSAVLGMLFSGFGISFTSLWDVVPQDTRGDRQPSFTQMDLEMTFADQDVIMKLTEELMRTVFKDVRTYHAHR